VGGSLAFLAESHNLCNREQVSSGQASPETASTGCQSLPMTMAPLLHDASECDTADLLWRKQERLTEEVYSARIL